MIFDDKNIVLVSGNIFQCQIIIKKAKEELEKFEYYSYGNDVSIEFLEQEIKSFSCFGEKRLFILNSYPLVKDKESVSQLLENLLKKIPGNCYVILNNIDIKDKEFISFLKKHGKIYSFNKIILRKNLSNFIIDYFNHENKIIDTESVNLLVNFMSVMGNENVNINKVLLNLKKIDWYVGDKKTINQEDILNVCEYSDDFIIWELFNFLDRRNYKGCVAILDKINNREDKDYLFTEEIINLFHLLYWRYKLLLLVKEYKIKGYSEDKIIFLISKIHKLERKENTFGYKTILELVSEDNIKSKKGKEKRKKPMEYSEKFISFILKGNNFVSPIISFYERKDLYYIIRAIGNSLLKIRIGIKCSRVEILNIVKSIFMMICHLKSEKELSMLREVKDKRLCYFQ